MTNTKGYKVIRFWNNDVWQNIAGILEVLEVIGSALTFFPHPVLPPQGGEGT
jgi:very-short-patch-repair endonuclease